MLAQQDPREAYRRVDFDARVSSANPAQLVSLCLAEFVDALGSALAAHERVDNAGKSRALTRSLSALTALQLGISSQASVGQALAHLYEAARRTVLDNVVEFDPLAVRVVRDDFCDIASALIDSKWASTD
jgi:flagellin-specific chaperone FliS